MIAKRRWYELLLTGLVILLITAVGAVNRASAYEYSPGGWLPYADWNSTQNVNESTRYIDTTAFAATDQDGAYECDCTAIAYAKANDDRADADAYSEALWLTDWTWDGPPESTAPGGELEWSQTAAGSATGAWGYNPTSGASASSAEACSWSVGTEGSAWADIYVWGLVDDGSASGGRDISADPNDELELDYESRGSYTSSNPPEYSLWEDNWNFFTTDIEVIASGTTYIYFAGGITCDVATSVISTEETNPWAEANANAIAANDISADFDSY